MRWSGNSGKLLERANAAFKGAGSLAQLVVGDRAVKVSSSDFV